MGLYRWSDVESRLRFYDDQVNPQPRPPLIVRLFVGHSVLYWVAGLGYGLAAWATFGLAAGPLALGVIATALVSIAIIAARRYPLASFAASLVALSLSPAETRLAWVALAPTGYLLFRVAANCSGRVALVVLAASIVGATTTALPGWQHGGGVIPFALLFTTAWVAGYAAGQRQRYTRDLLAHQTQVAEAKIDLARRGVIEERIRIARELHDVIAHSMSVITVQAGYGYLVSDDQPAQARAALGVIETTGRQTLVEMRHLLGVLRVDDPPAPHARPTLAPAPSLADLDQLIAQIAQAGVRIELTVSGTRPTLPADLDQCAYRIMQEALTNVVKHSGVSVANAEITYRRHEVQLEVTDSGNGGSDENTPGSGHGLIGMQERANLCGGRLRAGPLPYGGFQVVAILPITHSPA